MNWRWLGIQCLIFVLVRDLFFIHVVEGQSVECDAGMEYNLETSQCINCQPGKYKASRGEDGCADCNVHHYQNQSKATSCSLCMSPMFQWEMGQSECSLCPENEELYEEATDTFPQL